MKVDILVLNYNGKDLLGQFLPSVVLAAEKSAHQCKVTVVDNLSTDGSLEFLKSNFPSVGIYRSEKNDVVCSFNEALKHLDSDVVIMLGNDIKVKEDFVDYLAQHFSESGVFYAAPRLLNFDGTFNGGRSYLRFDYGVLKNEVYTEGAELPGETHSIGTGAFRRKEFIELGGFDRLFLPGIWEDVDLCYRARLLGKKGPYEPRSVIWHQESSTFNKVYGKRKKLAIAHRNMFLFIWKNICDPGFILQHIFFLPLRLAYAVLTGKPELAMGFFQALPRLPQAMQARKNCRRFFRQRKFKDRELIR